MNKQRKLVREPIGKTFLKKAINNSFCKWKVHFFLIQKILMKLLRDEIWHNASSGRYASAHRYKENKDELIFSGLKD